MSHFGLKQDPSIVTEKYDLAVVIGRFQCHHIGHSLLINKALLVAKHVLVLIGSSFSPRTIKNPFTFKERREMILKSVSEEDSFRIIASPLVDNLYSDSAWTANVQKEIDSAIAVIGGWQDKPIKPSITLVGNYKDESSYYLGLFPQYAFTSVDEVRLDLDATTLREILFVKPGTIDVAKSLVTPYTFEFLKDFMKTSEYYRLQREWIMVDKYKKSWESAPYPVIFTTVDAVVTFKGHLLMVRRKAAPGENLLALPGGFLNYNERLKDGAIRELIEETRIAIPPALIRSSIKGEGIVFDAPGRSLRGRTITYAFHFDLDSVLKDIDMPKVKGSDDAKEAMWLTFSEAIGKTEETYEDHQSIWRKVVGV